MSTNQRLEETSSVNASTDSASAMLDVTARDTSNETITLTMDDEYALADERMRSGDQVTVVTLRAKPILVRDATSGRSDQYHRTTVRESLYLFCGTP
ncbi:hypothetical protein KT71_002362 [Congregibacter litoralis KT71]|jgi:hypothetical protein|uniref:Uncharacterized protein n=1 Tax=Congregibacter litoralis KT71 TaxID=314285 RepID=V7HT72_9GAMM|nr:hypothetical protein KT71_002362 [Congregibacter litoralis KT71]